MNKNDLNSVNTKIDTLKSLDWDLTDVDTTKYSANIHPYHARFIPQIPERLISTYTEENDTVLDPFNGSGTSTMIAGTLQRKGVGVDLNPLACLIASVKCRKYDLDKIRKHTKEFLSTVKHNVRTIDSQPRISDYNSSHSEDIPTKIPDFPDQDRWYDENVLEQMGALFYLIENINPKRLRDFYRVCFSGITKKVCKSNEDWTYVGDNMFPDKDSNKLIPVNKVYDVYQRFENQVEKALDGIAQFSKVNPIEGEIHKSDSRDLEFLNDESVDFAVTSPPYANAVDYARYHRLSFYWFDWGVTETKEDEIGARSKRGRKNAVKDYFEESKQVYEEVYRVLKTGSHFCIIAGDTQHRNERVNATDQIIQMCEQIGYKYEDKITRRVSKQSMSQKNITEEELIILSK